MYNLLYNFFCYFKKYTHNLKINIFLEVIEKWLKGLFEKDDFISC